MSQITISELSELVKEAEDELGDLIRQRINRLSKESGVNINNIYVKLDNVSSLGDTAYSYIANVDIDIKI